MSNSTDKKFLLSAPAASYFSDTGIKFLAAHRFWIVCAVWLAARIYPAWGMTPDYVLEEYYRIAGDWLDGFIPYADFQVQYPPGALVLFSLPRIFFEAPGSYGYGFAAVMLVADLGILLFLNRIAAIISAREAHGDIPRQYQSTLLCLIYMLFTAFFGRLLLQRYDLIMTLLLTVVICLQQRRAMVFPIHQVIHCISCCCRHG